MRALTLSLVLLAACDTSGGDAHLDITFDPCSPIALVAAADTAPDELASVDTAAAMWRDAVGTQVARGAPDDDGIVVVRFEEAALNFRGIYLDEEGVVVVNRRLTDHHERAVVIAHELGHAFGLLHVDIDDRVSVMNRGNLVEEPNPGDAGDLAALWGRCAAGPIETPTHP